MRCGRNSPLIQYLIQEAIEDNEEQGRVCPEPICIKLSRRSGHTDAIIELAKTSYKNECLVVTNDNDNAWRIRMTSGGDVIASSISDQPPRGITMPKVVFIDNAFYCRTKEIDKWMNGCPGSQFVLVG